MNEFLGPLNWRPTSTESLVEPKKAKAASPTRNSIFATAPETQKSLVSSSGVRTSRWLPLPNPNPWSMNSNSMNHYQMNYNKWNNYLKSHSMWG